MIRLLPAALLLLAPLLAFSACAPTGEGKVTAATAENFSAIGADEVIHFTGTEPFWGGEARGSQLTYSTPENPDGARITVKRFTGLEGLGLSGTLEGAPFDLLVTQGECGDGMSDRTYPFTATLKLGEEMRNGCAWTDAQPFTGPVNP